MDMKERRDELFTNAMSYLMRDKLGMSIDLLDEIIKADSGDRLALMARGSVYLKMKNPKNAIADFDKVIEIDAKYPKSYHLRGLAREMEGNDEGAYKDFCKAIEIDPDYGAAYYSRATLLTKINREDEAAEDMKVVTQLTNVNIENFANENNVWRSRHLQMENIVETELDR
jgi:tetratricopeptide (TPR) repeat protein